MSKRILVVDDEPDVRFILQNILKSQGFYTEQSESIKQCFIQIERFEPDVIILDIDLPDGSGLDALPKIKESHPQTTVIINSALDTSDNRQLAKERGADAFIGKPLNKQKLLTVIS